MPLGRGPGSGSPPPPPGRTIPQEFVPGPYTPTWITPPDRNGDTVEVPLNPPGRGLMSLRDIAGLGVAPVDVATSANPDGGVLIDNIRPAGRQIVWPMRVRGRDNLEFLTRWRQMGQYLAMTRRFGPGKLRLTRADGTAREIACVYQSGWEGEPGDGAWLEDTCSVSLLCPDPFWRDATPTVLGPFTPEDPVDYLDPYPNIGTGQVIGSVLLFNPGQVDVWPTWTITGPITSLTATNETRDQAFELAYALDEGDTITISSRPIQVRGPAGENLISSLDLPGGKPWRLDAEGASEVTFVADGADEGTTVTLSFFPGYETA